MESEWISVRKAAGKSKQMMRLVASELGRLPPAVEEMAQSVEAVRKVAAIDVRLALSI